MYTQEQINIFDRKFHNFLFEAYENMEHRLFTPRERVFLSEVKLLTNYGKSYIEAILEHPCARAAYEDLPLFINSHNILNEMILDWRLDIGK